MKTLLIIFDNNTVKNTLLPDVLKRFEEESIKIILLVAKSKQSFYTKRYKNLGVTVDARPDNIGSPLENLAVFMARNSIPTHTVRQIQEGGFSGEGRLRLDKHIIALTTWFLSRFKLYRALLKKLLPLCFNHGLYKTPLDTYKPDLIFSPTMVTVNDFRLARAAQSRHIPIISMVKSWDNLTSKDFFLMPPDWLIVHNELIKKEVMTLHKYPEEKILVSGMPKFDRYADQSLPESRENFYKKYHLDPKKKTILYAAMGQWLVLYEAEMMKLLAGIVSSNKLAYPTQLIVRMHPAYKSEVEVVRGMPGVIIDIPGTPDFTVNPWKADYEFGEKDLQDLATLLTHSDVGINSGSTITLESVVFDLPTILVDFDAYHPNVVYWKSARRLLRREHCIPLVESGGVAIAHTEQQLIDAINMYLENPTLHHEGRKKIVSEECYVIDGKTRFRIAEFLIEKVKDGR